MHTDRKTHKPRQTSNHIHRVGYNEQIGKQMMEVNEREKKAKREESVNADDWTKNKSSNTNAKEDEGKERERRVNARRGGAYLTDNVVIVRQVVSVSLGSGWRGVAQFPYVWLRAVCCCRNREAIRLWLAALWAVLTGGGRRESVMIISQHFFISLEFSTFVSLHFFITFGIFPTLLCTVRLVDEKAGCAVHIHIIVKNISSQSM